MDQRQQGRLARWQGNMAATGSILGGVEKAVTFGMSGGFGGGSSGVNMQGQSKPLYNNPAFVRNM